MSLPEDYADALRQQENAAGDGPDRARDTWTPHACVEGGRPTIGYGHKLTEHDVLQKRTCPERCRLRPLRHPRG
jgi:hypothetical protein